MSQVPLFSLQTPSQHPVIAIVGADGAIIDPVDSATDAVIVDGTGIDPTGGSDSTAAMNTLIAETSVVATSAGRQMRIRWPDGEYLTDGIVAKPNIWYDFGNAVFKKNVDGTTPATNSMFRTIPVGVNTVLTVTNKELTSNIATLTTSAAHGRALGSTIVVAGVDATFNGTHTITSIPTTTTFTYAKTAANVASVASGGTATATTYYGAYPNIKVTGGTFDPNGFTCPAHVVNLIYCEDLEMSGVNVKHDPANLTWAYCIGGRRLTLNDLRCEDGLEVFQDGLHILHGQDITINGGHFASGDDALAIGGAITTDPYAAADPDPVRRVVVTGYTADSKKGHALRIYVDPDANGPLWEVTNVEVHGIVGKAGQLRNGGIFIESHQSLASPIIPVKMVRHVNIDGVDLTVGSLTHDDVNAVGVMVQSAEDVNLDVHMEFLENPGAAVGFDFVKIRESLDVNVRARCRSMPHRYGVDARTSSRVTVLPGTTLKYGPDQLLNPINFVDVPDAKVQGATLTGIRNGVGGILVASGTTTSLIVSGTTVAHEAGPSSGDAVQVVGGTVTSLSLLGNDFSDAFRGADPAILRTIGALVSGNQGLNDLPRSAAYLTVRGAKGKYDAVAASTQGLWDGGPASPGGSLGGYLVFYLDPADWPGGVTSKCRVRATVTTNATAPVSDFTVGLYPVSASAGGAAAVSATLGTVVAGSTAVVTAPALGTRSVAVSSEFDCPVAGFYAFGVVIGSSMAASSSVVVGAVLQSRAT